MVIPEVLNKLGKKSLENQKWVDSLPKFLEKLIEEWNLELGSVYTDNVSCSYVVNCIVQRKYHAVLKIGLPHLEAINEIEGLDLLNGNPTVKLLKYNKEMNAMLLEKCIPGTNLNRLQEPFQDKIICNLLKELWNVNYKNENFRPLEKMVNLWNEETYKNLNSFPDSNLAKEGCLIKEELINSTKQSVLLATDLHAGNVLKAQRKPWLAIDIKPFIGDRTYDLTQHLLNCIERLENNPKQTIYRVANLAKVDSSRLTDWLFARLASENKGIHQKLALTLKELR